VRRFFLITLLMMSSAPAYAEWLWASANDIQGLTIYVDPDSIRRKGDLVTLWQLYDYKAVQTVAGNSFLSSKAQRQFDCGNQRTKLLAFTHFTGNMGNGNRVMTDSDEAEWKSVTPGSVGHVLWRFACSKR
jgi:hypothetical protein